MNERMNERMVKINEIFIKKKTMKNLLIFFISIFHEYDKYTEKEMEMENYKVD
jgi:hypothetical protein